MAVLSDSARIKLEKNPNVLKVTAKNVTYTAAFKLKAVQKYLEGETYEEIFLKANIDVSFFEKNYTKKCIERWCKIFESHGEEGFTQERRGLGATGRPKGAKKFKTLEAEVAYLRAENDFLKKLNALEAAYLKKKNSR